MCVCVCLVHCSYSSNISLIIFVSHYFQLSKLAAEDEIRKEMVSIEELMSKAALL